MDIREFKWLLSTYMIVIGVTGFFITGCESIPDFEGIPRYIEVYENISIGTQLFMMSATDTDQNNIMTFKATDAETNTSVNIIQFSNLGVAKANVTVRTPPDRESNVEGIELKFYVIDSSGDTVDREVHLYILDVCDEFPHFEKPSYNFEIYENYMNGTNAPLPVYSEIHATDKDNGINAFVFYDMESSYWWEKYNKTFSIDPQSGNIYLLQDLNYEESSFYQFTLHAHDTCNPNETPADLTIKVKDVQDMPPFFIGLPYMKNINEGDYSVHPLQLLQVSAFDGDRGIPNEVGYRIIPSNGCSRNTKDNCNFCESIFQIDASTGNFTVIGNLDWSMLNVTKVFGICTITVEAKEKDTHPEHQRGKTASNTTVTVTIVDTNNHAPKLAFKSYNGSIEENAVKGTVVLLCGGAAGIEISDLDQGFNSNFNVTLGCNNQPNCDTFEVVPSTIVHQGVITIRVNNNSLLDYEQSTNITITLYATEEKDKSHSDTATVTIQIINVNEFSPKFTNTTYEVSIPEEPANGTSVITITATDSDHGKLGVVSYSLAEGNNLFLVDERTGQVVTNCAPKDLDREQLHDIYLSLTATDEGYRMNQAQLIVHLLDVNDNAPVFQQKRYKAILDENSTTFINESFMIVKATDTDEGNNSEVLYEIKAISNLDRNFTINIETGEMSLVYTLDYEALDDQCNGVINVTVYAYNHGAKHLSSNVTVTIVVQDVNDNAPRFSKNGYIATIKENAVEGTYVGMVNATDADTTERNNKIAFAIKSGGLDKFQINSTTGNITVQVGAHFDRDDIKLYNLTIIAIDHGENSFTDTTTMSVTIKDVNNKLPTFDRINYSVRVYENITLGSLLTNCIAKDPDENPSLNYKFSVIVGWNERGVNVNKSILESSIGIYEENGTLYVKNGLDRETVAKLEITIFVNDTEAEDNKPQTATATVTITVLDVDDNPPIYKKTGDLRVGMKSNTEQDKEIFQLKSNVADEDSPQNAVDKWVFKTILFQMTTDLENKLSRLKQGYRCDDPICITRNGTIINNMYYSEDMSGFFNITVLVKDDAGNDTASILIFLVTDSQVLKMTIYRSLTEASLIKDQILNDCSHVTGLLFVYDSIKGHKDNDGTVDTFRTDLFFHIQDSKNNRVLLAEEAKRLFDEYADKLYYMRMKHSIVSIESSMKSENPENESTISIYVMAAVIAFLTLVVFIGGCIFFSSSRRQKRKLRAAMSPATEINIPKKDDVIVPGSNMYADKENPLLNTPYSSTQYAEIDARSQTSMERNRDDPKTSHKGTLQEREVTPDMDGDNYYTIILAEDPYEVPLRQQDAQKQASMQKLGDSGISHNKNEYDEETMVSGIDNNGYLTVRNLQHLNAEQGDMLET